MTSPDLPPHAHGRAEVVVDLAAVRRNVATLKAAVGQARMMTVVKADGYGHGMVEVARAAREGGADWLGVAVMEEALALRAAGDTGPILTWLAVPGESYAGCVEAGVDVTAYTVAELDEIATDGPRDRRPRPGPAQGRHRPEPGRLDRAAVARRSSAGRRRGGGVRRGPGHRRLVALRLLRRAGPPGQRGAGGRLPRGLLRGSRAPASSPRCGTWPTRRPPCCAPSSRFDLVRCGIASYGLSPAPDVVTSAELGLVPAMTVRGRLALVKRVPAGAGVSYGHTYRHRRPRRRVGVVPMGYGDGVPRHASSRAEVLVAGRRRAGARPGLHGPARRRPRRRRRGDRRRGGAVRDRRDGEPTAQDWAEACGTIGYEIVTRMGAKFRVHGCARVHVDTDTTEGADR